MTKLLYSLIFIALSLASFTTGLLAGLNAGWTMGANYSNSVCKYNKLIHIISKHPIRRVKGF